MSAIGAISAGEILMLLCALEITIRGANQVSLITEDNNEPLSHIRRRMGAAEACLTHLRILRPPNMPKQVYMEDVINRIILYMTFQIENIVLPYYYVTYIVDNNNKKDNWMNNSANLICYQS